MKKFNSIELALMFFKSLLTLIIYFLPFVFYGQKVIASSYGFNTDDNKKVLYEAIKNNDTIIIDRQDKDWVVSPLTMRNLTNKTIIFDDGIFLRAKEGAFPKSSDALLKFYNCKNLKIYGNQSVLIMNKDEYVDGEWRMGISLLGCENVLIQDITVSSTGGDGIYIDGYRDIIYSENIFIENIVSTNNKRQGMSIISAKNVWVKNSIFTKTNGTLPEAGLDIEPDSETDVISNVNFEDCIFNNNNHSGILLALSNLTDKSHPVSINFKNCYLSMNHDLNNRYPKAEIIISSHPEIPVKGKVKFSDIIVNGSNWRFLFSRKLNSGYHVAFENIYVKDICKQYEEQSAIYLGVPDSFRKSGSIGGFSFKNIFFEYNSRSSIFTIKGSRLRTLKGVENITGDITVLNSNLIDLKDYKMYNSDYNKKFSVDFTIINSVNNN